MEGLLKCCKTCGGMKRLEDFPSKGGGARRAHCKTCYAPKQAAKFQKWVNKPGSRISKAQANRTQQLVNLARQRAIEKGLPFDLDVHDITCRVKKGVCEVTGIPFSSPRTGEGPAGARWDSPSLDRIVPSKGYVTDNVQIVIWALNAMRGNWGDEIMLKVARARQTLVDPKELSIFPIHYRHPVYSLHSPYTQ